VNALARALLGDSHPAPGGSAKLLVRTGSIPGHPAHCSPNMGPPDAGNFQSPTAAGNWGLAGGAWETEEETKNSPSGMETRRGRCVRERGEATVSGNGGLAQVLIGLLSPKTTTTFFPAT